MGVKKSVQSATDRVASRLKQTSLVRRLSNPSSVGSLSSRSAEWIYVVALFMLAGGLINAWTNGSQAGITSVFIVQNPSVQNVTETVIMLFTYILGALGAYSLYLSGRQTIRARPAEMFFVFGLSLISIAMLFGYFILSVK